MKNLLIGLLTFGIIGVFHPVVIQAEYHLGKNSWPIFALAGVLFCVIAFFTEGMWGIVAAIVGFSSFRSILELVHQEKRVDKG